MVAGFTGQLKGWWDHLLSNSKRSKILNSIQLDDDGAPILDEQGNPIEDAVSTLIYSIAKQFLGNLSVVRSRTSEVLSNLRCPKLQDFRWYKDVFFTAVLTHSDCNQSFWKEKFIAGLPNLFAERVRKTIKNKNDGHIPYDDLTYGDIISTITAEGIALCTDFKLQQQIQHERATSRKELGSFCQQFGFEKLTPPSKQQSRDNKKRNSNNRPRQFTNRQTQNYYKKPAKIFHDPKPLNNSNQKPLNNSKTSSSQPPIRCYKCGRLGHTNAHCFAKK